MGKLVMRALNEVCLKCEHLVDIPLANGTMPHFVCQIEQTGENKMMMHDLHDFEYRYRPPKTCPSLEDHTEARRKRPRKRAFSVCCTCSQFNRQKLECKIEQWEYVTPEAKEALATFRIQDPRDYEQLEQLPDKCSFKLEQSVLTEGNTQTTKEVNDAAMRRLVTKSLADTGPRG